MTLEEKIMAPGQKKILTLDGGGIRGMMSIEILAGIEKILRESMQNDKLVLADWFDFFAGTSTGAIIATCLSLGMSTDEIRQFYLENSTEMFDKAFLLRRYRYKYDDEKLAGKLKAVFNKYDTTVKNVTLGSDKLRTLLMMVMRNVSTDSPWPLSNNPFAKYNQKDRKDCNLYLPLWQLVRASTAAPVYFPPEVIDTGKQEFIFEDGGITTYNNPSFQAFLMATVGAYKLNWPVGIDKLLLVSIGTGTSPQANADLDPSDMNLIYNAGSIPSALMFAALNEQDFLCRTFGDCLTGDPLDREVGDMIGITGPVQPKLFTYVRYNAELTCEGLEKLGLANIEPKNVQKLDSTDHITELQQVGKAVVDKKVRREHFGTFIGG
ncbi:MAG: patatin-like phospholipase family protein [Desulfocapsaceae bacterium]|nr:patatin-like phospholipase family protein [Desulfocapsaceae bacterium]